MHKPFLYLGNMPLSNALVDNMLALEPYYPLDVYVCPECYLVQIPEYESAINIFSSKYVYYSSYSETWLSHCKNYVDMMIGTYKYDNNSLIVEIGSNDGYLLQYFKNNNIPIFGIDPAKSVADIAIKKGIPTDSGYFNIDYSMKMVQDNKMADLIIGNNVLAHNPDLHNFVQGMKNILKPDGIITMEFPYLFNLIRQNQFDTIYHEHFSYFSLYSVIKLFDKHRLVIFDVEEVPTHGGSLRIYIRHIDDTTKSITNNIHSMLEKEIELRHIDTYNDFHNKTELIKRNLLEILIKLKNENKKIVGYGAPAKGNTLLNYCGIRTDLIDYTVDASPLKQGLFMAGSHIPIKHPDTIKEDRPDYILIFPWNIKDEIIGQLNYTKNWNCKFIIPIPMPYII